MTQSRRQFLSGAVTAAAIASASADATAAPAGDGELEKKVVAEFSRLPGKNALKFWAPAADGRAEWSATLNPETPLFCGSSFKVFVLTEYLRQREGEPGEIKKRLAEELVLDESVFSPSSPVFNPPNLSGKVTALTVLEAMIVHSDNTATDMALKHAGADKVRQFVSSIGLRDARIPTSTRQFFGYIVGDPEWRTLTWPKIARNLADEKSPYQTRPIINDVETMVCSPRDFVSFYARALHGEFFKNKETTDIFRAILSRSDSVAGSMPLGVSGFAKGGSIEFANDRVMCIAGGMWAARRWVYFALITNAEDKELTPKYIQAARTIFAMVNEGLGRVENHVAKVSAR